MRNYLSYITCLIAAAFISSCVKIDIQPLEQVPVGDLTSVTLQLKSSDLVATRVSGDDDDLNEYSINHIQCFFSVNDNDGIDNNTIVYATDVITIPANQAGAQSGTVTDLEIIIPSDKMTPLFSDGNCSVYVVANGPDAGIGVTDTTTIAGVKATAVSLEQYETSGEGKNMISQAAAQTSFVMDGDAVVSKATDNGIVKISGTVRLYRVAAKLLVNLNVARKIVYDNGTPDTNDDVTWEPNLDSIKISYINSLTESTLAATSPNTVEEGDLNEYLQQPYGNYKVYDIPEATEGNTIFCTQEIPFYTYPYDWSGSNNPEPAISLIIPWTSGNIKQYFEYQIPINPKKTEHEVTTDTKSLVRNTVYEMTVNVGILGGLTKPVDLKPSYIVTDWGTGAIDAELSRPTYLIVDEHYVEMNNENSHAVGYSSSDEIEVTIKSIIKPDLTSPIVTYPDIVGNDDHGFTISKTGQTKGVINLNHTLQNDNTKSGFDYVPYTVTVEVSMSVGNEKFVEEITFIQYPQMYIIAYTNKDFSEETNTATWTNSWNNHHGYMFVNGYSTSTIPQDRWRNEIPYPNASVTVNNVNVQHLGTNPGITNNAGNKNPNMYVINVSYFSDATYRIGDPRLLDVDQDLCEATFTPYGESNSKTIWTVAPAVGGGNNRILTNYYPTDPSVSNQYTIAPKIRVASSFSVTQADYLNDQEMARRRCASYQEDGYPAGRWRLPTYAEVAYMVTLSYRNLIPKLYSDGTNYWCANGTVKPSAGNVTLDTTPSSGSVRCVYDEWYWGSNPACDRNTFTWGDAPRN